MLRVLSALPRGLAPHGSSQLSVTLISGDPMHYSNLQRHSMYVAINACSICLSVTMNVCIAHTYLKNLNSIF